MRLTLVFLIMCSHAIQASDNSKTDSTTQTSQTNLATQINKALETYCESINSNQIPQDIRFAVGNMRALQNQVNQNNIADTQNAKKAVTYFTNMLQTSQISDKQLEQFNTLCNAAMNVDDIIKKATERQNNKIQKKQSNSSSNGIIKNYDNYDISNDKTKPLMCLEDVFNITNNDTQSPQPQQQYNSSSADFVKKK